MLALAIRYGRELTIPFNFLQLNAWGLFLSLHSSKLKDRLEKGGGKTLKVQPPCSSASLELAQSSSLRPSTSHPISPPEKLLAQKTWKNSKPWLNPPSNPILSGLSIFKHRAKQEPSPSTLSQVVPRCLSPIHGTPALVCQQSHL